MNHHQVGLMVHGMHPTALELIKQLQNKKKWDDNVNTYYFEFTLILISMMVGFFVIQPISLLIVLIFLYRYWLYQNTLELRRLIYTLLVIHGWSGILFVLHLVFFNDHILSIIENIGGQVEFFIVSAVSLCWFLSFLFAFIGCYALIRRKYFVALYWHLSILIISLATGIVWFVSKI